MYSGHMKRIKIPKPPHPTERRVPLPVHCRSPARDDPKVQKNIELILENPNYREADQDPDFLHLGEVRGLRLQADYLKAELLMQQNSIESTIVVFGSTRLRDTDSLQCEIDDLLKEKRPNSRDKSLTNRLKTLKHLQTRSKYYDAARELGRMVAKYSQMRANNKLVVMTGGGPGIMEAANRGAFDKGAKTVGLNIHLPHEQFPNPYITPDLCFRFHYFAMRKLHFLMRAKALVAFPGGYGTFDELFETLTLVQTRTIKPVPIVLVGKSYWKKAVDFDFLASEGVIDEEDRDLFWYAESAKDIWDGICQWHEDNGQRL